MKTVLIVEDDKIVARLYRTILERAGYETEVVTDGRVALEKIRARPPDGLLLDLMLPGVSGIEVLKQIRSEGLQIPVVVCTNASVPIMLNRAKEAGATLVFDKSSMSPTQLAEAFQAKLAPTMA